MQLINRATEYLIATIFCLCALAFLASGGLAFLGQFLGRKSIAIPATPKALAVPGVRY
jgi:hypothetical protein